jgi:hypothetical protein
LGKDSRRDGWSSSNTCALAKKKEKISKLCIHNMN